MRLKIIALTTGSLMLFATGCATTPTTDMSGSPTHRWVPSEVVTKAEYNWDHSACIGVSNVEVDGTTKSDPTFVAYEQCMTERGYTLATY